MIPLIDGTNIIRIDKTTCVATSVQNNVPSRGWKNWSTLAELDGISTFSITGIEWAANRTGGTGIAFTMAIDDVRWWKMN